VNGNCLDHCVLEWCKLFGRKDAHCWRKIVTDPVEFEADLLRHLALERAEFQAVADKVHYYRNNFVAHLTSDKFMDIPVLDVVRAATWFYHTHVVNKEVEFGDLSGYVANQLDPTKYYELCENEAKDVYSRIQPSVLISRHAAVGKMEA